MAAVVAGLAAPGLSSAASSPDASASVFEGAQRQRVSQKAVGASDASKPLPARSAAQEPGRQASAARSAEADARGVPDPFTSWPQLMRVQGQMNETASTLEYTKGQSEQQGLAGVIAAPEEQHLTVYWHGALTPAAKTAIAHSSIPVVVKSAKYGATELGKASARVVRRAESAGVELVKVIRPQDGSGLQASVVGGEAEAVRLRNAVASVGVPVKVTSGGEVQVSLADNAGRHFDPTAGGAQMVEPVCSTAFTARYRGMDTMLTADHCFAPGYPDERWTSSGQGSPFGKRASPRDTSAEAIVDVAAMSPLNGTAFQPRVWTGAAADKPSIEQTKNFVTGAQVPQKGNWICNEGSRSGEICNIQITDRSEDYFAKGPDGDGKEVTRHYKWGWDAKKRVTSASPSPIAGRRGDSGGPVVLSSQGASTAGPMVTAMGIVSASAGKPFICPTGIQTYCFKAITIVGIDDALNYLGDSTITVTDSADTSVRRSVSFQGQAPTPAPVPTPEVQEHDELVAANGSALTYDAARGALDADFPGDDRADWELQQATDGGWLFQNLASPQQFFGESADVGLRIVSVGDGWGDEWVYIQHQGQCLDLAAFGDSAGGLLGVPSLLPCDSGDADQVFRLVPVADDLSDPVDLPPVSDGSMNLPSRKPPAGLPRLAVMPLGDSITLGVGSSTRTGYRPGLARRLTGSADTVQFVGSQTDPDGTHHEGHSGWLIEQLQANIETWLADAKPNVVLLHIGTNDMNRDNQVSTAPQRLGGLLDQIHAASPDTAIVLASLVPATDPAVQARVNAYNAAIPGVIAARTSKGYRITQVSMGALTTADLNDNLHPNNAGYEKMADAFQGGIATLARNGWIKEFVEVKPAPPKRTSNLGDADVDINGDGLADYLVVEDNGATHAWLNAGAGKWTDQGIIASGSASWTGSQVRFANVGGDARADYLVVDPNGAVRAFINQGGDGRGGWIEKGYIATGSAGWTGEQVRFADVGGDAYADYLVVNDNGSVRALLNTTQPDTGTIKWTDQGVIASGSASWTSGQVRFANVGGDARADYLVVDPNGAVRAFINQGGDGRGGWIEKGYIATGSAGWTGEQVRFANVGGDAYADYLVLGDTGSIQGFLNTTQPDTGTIKWTDQGTIATGTGAPGSRVRI
ncbi:GDSL-type esterase/lipase family protein [Streptomyces sp. NBC_00876]|uniref:GDSL-type esterase/lipase family protein n=1 Tax=Streptomyces sp. NBC_00876 TaxID=2975853 RepID=UPI00386F07A3|nr:GDSL-type esterase/lipase family protein [Streptomyces sp. NBC_00876]